MKKILPTLVFAILLGNVYSQNTFPATGNVGIGTTTPRLPLEVKYNVAMHASPTGSMFILDGFGMEQTNAYSHVRLVATSTGGSGFLKSRIDNYAGAFTWVRNSDLGEVLLMKIDAASGNVGIGTDNPGTFKLAVEGKIGAREIKVTQTNPWPDYVFNNRYQLRSLASLEKYINQYKHLPGIPSAEEINKNGGIELGEMNRKLLEKVEELTLYVIELKKENEQIKKELQKVSSASQQKN
jgi:hypothetical protein